MINKIFCNAKDCTHNHSGACASGVIDVQSYVGPEVAAFCNSYAVENSVRADVSQHLTSTSTTVNAIAQQTGLTEENTSTETDFIGCTAVDCVYNNNRMCGADAIYVQEPSYRTGTLSLCGTYNNGKEWV